MADEPTRPGGLVVDLTPIREFVDKITELEVAWANLTPTARAALSRMLWLHPDGKVVAYTTNVDDEPKR